MPTPLVGAHDLAGSGLAKTRSRIGVAARLGDAEQLRIARRDHAAEKIAAYVRRVVDEAPPFTESQKDELVALLQGGASA